MGRDLHAARGCATRRAPHQQRVGRDGFLYDPADQVPYFSTIGGVAIVMGIALLLAVRPVLALMRGVR
ncbi:hypothetical protein [uncultured Microbacterium sp.]|uniref:hypothetical protein n=1 Tax=uncultured Microbacterium sp. TaxID=191216 RepID=UPI00260FFEA6|nr:hypothetical protein [uncultured Microbacterium sp.]